MAQQFRAKIAIPAVTRYNYVTLQYDEVTPAHELTMVVDLDLEKIARTMGIKAAHSKSRKSIDAGGALVVKVVGGRPEPKPRGPEHGYETAKELRQANYQARYLAGAQA